MPARLIGSIVVAALLLAGCFSGGSAPTKQEAPSGRLWEFDLYLYPLMADGSTGSGWELYPGVRVDAWAFASEPDPSRATVPGPTIRVRQGDTVRVNFHSMAPMAHSLNFHGVNTPWDQSGIPYLHVWPIGDVAFGGDGERLTTYEFVATHAGTFYYHCAVDMAHHMDMGMYGPFIVDPIDDEEDLPYDVEAILVLDEWDRSHSHQNAAALASAISPSGDPRVTADDVYATGRDFVVGNSFYNDAVSKAPLKNAPGVRETRDWYPVTYAPYFAQYDTFLINGRAAPSTEPIYVETGQVLRLRIIHAGFEPHSIHLVGHPFLVTHKDGYALPAPYRASTVLVGPGEQYDVYVTADNPGPWPILDHDMRAIANDYIHPGGMMTIICYVDGWEDAEVCEEGRDSAERGVDVDVGAIMAWRATALGH